MPETAVHEDGRAPRAKDDVGSPRKIARVHAIAVAQAMQDVANSDFRTCVLSANARHQGASLRRAHDVAPAHPIPGLPFVAP